MQRKVLVFDSSENWGNTDLKDLGKKIINFSKQARDILCDDGKRAEK